MYSIHATFNAILKGFSKKEHETLRSPVTHGTVTYALIVGKMVEVVTFLMANT